MFMVEETVSNKCNLLSSQEFILSGTSGSSEVKTLLNAGAQV